MTYLTINWSSELCLWMEENGTNDLSTEDENKEPDETTLKE